MTEIKNIETLHAEIKRLKSDITLKEYQMREHVSALKENLKPANLLSSLFFKRADETESESNKGFAREAVKTGLSMLVGKFLLSPGQKTEQRISDMVDKVFNKAHDFIERKRKRKNEKRYYQSEDDYESESN